MVPGPPAVPFGRYALRERVAQGGMGEVFRAVAIGERGFEKPVIVKRILPAHAGRDDLADLFVAEAKLMTRLAHPNVVEVLDFGRGAEGDYYLVLELVDGLDLDKLLRFHAEKGERFPVPLALFVAAQALRGLHHAHRLPSDEGGVLVHRDVSPSNVLLSTEGEVKVADFGVAMVRSRAEAEGGAARPTSVAGKPGYMAPEQFDGRDVDPRADVFSAGVVLYQMLSGRLPFAGSGREAEESAARRGEHAPIASLREGLRPEVAAIVERALSVDREARFPDARAMAQAIEGTRALGQTIASSDDLAEVVQAARVSVPSSSRPVLHLSAGGELTRTGALDGLSAFTRTSPVRPEGSTQPVTPSRVEGRAGARRTPLTPAEPATERLPMDREHAELDPAAPLAPSPSAEANGLGESRAEIKGYARPSPSPSGGPREDSSPDTRPVPSSQASPARRSLLLVAAAASALGVVLVAQRAPLPRTAFPIPELLVLTARPAAASPAASSARETAPVVAPTEAPLPAAASASAGIHGRPAASSRTGPAVSAAPVASASASAGATETGCTGRVHISSNGSWNVAGGPQQVQSPGWYTWKCGTFALQATSREDPSESKSASVVVREGKSSEVDLR